VKLGTRIWALITIVVVVALVAGGYFLGAAPLLQQQAKAEADRKSALAVNQGLEAEIARLKAAELNLDEYQALATDFARLVPDGVDSQRFIRSLDAIASANAVTIAEITIDAFVPYVPPKTDEDADEKAPPPYTDDRINSNNFVIVPFSVTVEGGWAESLSFVHQLQFGDRLVLLTGIDQSITDSAYSTKITAYMYVRVPPGGRVTDTKDTGTEESPAPTESDEPATEPTDDETASARG
jgi:hypothetical protein